MYIFIQWPRLVARLRDCNPKSDITSIRISDKFSFWTCSFWTSTVFLNIQKMRQCKITDSIWPTWYFELDRWRCVGEREVIILSTAPIPQTPLPNSVTKFMNSQRKHCKFFLSLTVKIMSIIKKFHLFFGYFYVKRNLIN